MSSCWQRSGSADAVVAYDAATGDRAWRLEVGKPVVSIFEPRAGYVGVGLLGGDVQILKARSGEVMLERSDPSVRAVTAGVMWAGTLVLRSNALRGPRQALELAAFDIATGAEIWRRIFPQAVPTEGLDLERLARLNVAGGHIRNIAMNATFLAADAGEAVTMRHLLQAARGEYAKLEKPLTEAEIARWVS